MQERIRILVVDDESIVLEVTRLALEMTGRYDVSAHTDPCRALEAFKADPAGFALLITDFKMPRMNGAELAAQIRRINPLVPIVCVSAYVKPEATQDNLFNVCLSKPFDVRDLQELVGRLADPCAGREIPTAVRTRAAA